MSWNESIITYQAGEALEAKRRVKIETGTTSDPPEVVYADAGEDHVAVTEYAVKDGEMVACKPANFPGVFEIECLVDSAIARGTVLYGAADGMLADTVSGSPLAVSLEVGVDNKHIRVAPWSVKSTTAAATSFADAAGATAAATVEDDLAELYAHLQSAEHLIEIPIGSFTEQDGTVLAAFADGDSTTPGMAAGDESFGIRWNNHATPDPISANVAILPRLNPGKNVILHLLAAKVGATVGDAVTWLVEAFNNLDGAAYDADADFGGTSSAMTGDATSKDCQEETLTLATANIAADPGMITLTIQPTDGTLGTDDVILMGVWLEFEGQVLT